MVSIATDLLWYPGFGGQVSRTVSSLDKDQIQSSFALPKNTNSEPELFLILEVMDEILLEAHGWCFDGPDCMLTWPRQLALSRFHIATVGKARGFEPKKELDIVKNNRRYWKQFLTYYYRVIHSGGHFTNYYARCQPVHSCGARESKTDRHCGFICLLFYCSDLSRVWWQPIQLSPPRLLCYAYC
jgi:hypothetical protein